jgi:hypothetical protein
MQIYSMLLLGMEYFIYEQENMTTSLRCRNKAILKEIKKIIAIN